MRDAWLDNVKMTLVTVVVIGHAIVLAPVYDGSGRLYDFIYAWHIPAFVLITGYFSRSFQWTQRHLIALVTTIAVPYVIFELAMYYFRVQVGGDQIGGTLFLDPHWPVWYLAAVFLWRLAAPILKRHWVAIPLSVLASISFALVGSSVLDLNRVIGFLPFFVIGLHLTPELLSYLHNWWVRIGAGAVVLVLWQAAAHTDELIPHPATYSATTWLWYAQPYAVFGVSPLEGMLTRLCLIGVSALAALSVMALIPRGRSWYAEMGAASLIVYLLHGFAVRGAEYAGYAEWAAGQGNWTIWPTVLGAIAVALLLASPPVARRLQVAVDPVNALRKRLAASTTVKPTLIPVFTDPHPTGGLRRPVMARAVVHHDERRPGLGAPRPGRPEREHAHPRRAPGLPALAGRRRPADNRP